jgi:hypothetical protein
LHLLIAAAVRQKPSQAAAPDAPLDLSTMDADPATVLREVDLGSRYVRLWTVDAGRIVFSPILVVRRGTLPPGGWKGGADVTQRLLVALGFPPMIVAHANAVSAPSAFPGQPAGGVPVPDSPRYTRTGGFIASTAVFLIVAVCTWAVYAHERYAVQTDVGTALFHGFLVAALVGAPVAWVAAWIVGSHVAGGPFHRRKWGPAFVLPVVAPIVLVAVGARLLLQQDLDRLQSGLSGLDLAGPDLAAGFATSPFDVPEMSYPDAMRSWRLGENRHPPEVPRYGPSDKGVIVDWTEGGRSIAPISLYLPDDLRAERVDEVRWIAYLTRPLSLDAFRYSNGARTDVLWDNLRIVDVPSGRLVAHGTAMSLPPSQTSDAPRQTSVDGRDAAALVVEAIAGSYATAAGSR